MLGRWPQDGAFLRSGTPKDCSSGGFTSNSPQSVISPSSIHILVVPQSSHSFEVQMVTGRVIRPSQGLAPQVRCLSPSPLGTGACGFGRPLPAVAAAAVLRVSTLRRPRLSAAAAAIREQRDWERPCAIKGWSASHKSTVRPCSVLHCARETSLMSRHCSELVV